MINKIKLALNMLYAYPGWLISKYGCKLRSNHPWALRDRFFTLKEWTVGRTKLMLMFDFNFWVLILCLVAIIDNILHLIT